MFEAAILAYKQKIPVFEAAIVAYKQKIPVFEAAIVAYKQKVRIFETFLIQFLIHKIKASLVPSSKALLTFSAIFPCIRGATQRIFNTNKA